MYVPSHVPSSHVPFHSGHPVTAQPAPQRMLVHGYPPMQAQMQPPTVQAHTPIMVPVLQPPPMQQRFLVHHQVATLPPQPQVWQPPILAPPTGQAPVMAPPPTAHVMGHQLMRPIPLQGLSTWEARNQAATLPLTATTLNSNCAQPEGFKQMPMVGVPQQMLNGMRASMPLDQNTGRLSFTPVPNEASMSLKRLDQRQIPPTGPSNRSYTPAPLSWQGAPPVPGSVPVQAKSYAPPPAVTYLPLAPPAPGQVLVAPYPATSVPSYIPQPPPVMAHAAPGPAIAPAAGPTQVVAAVPAAAVPAVVPAATKPAESLSPSKSPEQAKPVEVPTQPIQPTPVAVPVQQTAPAVQPEQASVPVSRRARNDAKERRWGLPQTVLCEEGVERIEPDEMLQLLKAKQCTLVDVRGSDRDTGYIPGSIHVPCTTAQPFFPKVPDLAESWKDETLVVFSCQYSCHRAPTCANWYRKAAAATQRVAVLEGGFRGWEALKYPIQTDQVIDEAAQTAADEHAIKEGTAVAAASQV